MSVARTRAYARDSSVSVERSRSELERELRRFGAEDFVILVGVGRGGVQCKLGDRWIRLAIVMPPVESFLDDGKRRVSPSKARLRWEQEERRLWRVLVMLTKAKLVAVSEGLTDVQTAFLGETILPDASTVADWLVPQVEYALETGRMPSLLDDALPALPAPREGAA